MLSSINFIDIILDDNEQNLPYFIIPTQWKCTLPQSTPQNQVKNKWRTDLTQQHDPTYQWCTILRICIVVHTCEFKSFDRKEWLRVLALSPVSEPAYALIGFPMVLLRRRRIRSHW